MLAIVVVLSSGLLASDIKKDINACSALNDDKVRLLCFDAVARSSVHPKTKSKKRQWEFSADKNLVDDDVRLTVINESEEKVDSIIGVRSSAFLYVRCQNGSTDVFMSTPSVADHEDNGVRIRFDSDQAERYGWVISRDRKALFLADDGKFRFIEKLTNSKQLIIEWTPWISNPQTAVFDLSGFGEASRPLGDKCRWSMASESVANALSETDIAGIKVIEGLGLSVVSYTDEIAKRLGKKALLGGAVVVDIVAGGPAQKAGIMEFDVIVSARGKAVHDAAELFGMISGNPPPHSLGVWSNERRDVVIK